MQEWWDWDGIGRYKSRRHDYPVNLMLRLVLGVKVALLGVKVIGVIKFISNSEFYANLCKYLSVKVTSVPQKSSCLTCES